MRSRIRLSVSIVMHALLPVSKSMESSHLGWLEGGIDGLGGCEVGEVGLKSAHVEQNQKHELKSYGWTANVSGLVHDQLQTHQVRKEAQWIHLEMHPRMSPVWSS